MKNEPLVSRVYLAGTKLLSKFYNYKKVVF